MMSRRSFGSGLGALLAGAALRPRRSTAEVHTETPGRKYLFVFTAFGGASIIDSLLPIAASTSPNAGVLTTFADAQVDQVGAMRCVAPLVTEANNDPQRPPVRFAQRDFLVRHGSDTAVLTVENSSVSHPTAQARAMSGGGSANRGRTILETVAEVHGQGLPMPVVNMASQGFVNPGSDLALSPKLQQVAVLDPRSFALGTHSSRGLVRPIADDLVARARRAREQAEARSRFEERFVGTESLRRWSELRERGAVVEAADLVTKLMLVGQPGIPASSEVARLKTYLPSLEIDVMEAEAALAFLLALNGVSCALAIGSLSVATRELVGGVPTASVYPTNGFDASHNSHRVSQSSCWSRLFRVMDGLVRLLKDTPDPSAGGASMWSNSLIFVTTDFGREKTRPRDALVFGSGHHLNNGCILVSPLIKGGRAYGGVDPQTALTYGFDPVTGEPRPNTVMSEDQIYGAVAHALGVAFPGRKDMPAIVR